MCRRELELLSADFDRGFEHEMHCRKVCSLPAHTGPKKHLFDFQSDLKNQIESDPNFLSKVIMGDESWCYGYDPETKEASCQWKTPTTQRPKKARQVRSNVKTMLIGFFFYVQGTMHWEFFPPG